MTIQSVIKINGQFHEIASSQQNGTVLILNQGKRFAIADFKAGRIIHKHVLSGRFQSTRIR